MTRSAFTPHGTDPATGESAWHAADFDQLVHTLEASGTCPVSDDRPIIFGRHAAGNPGTKVVVTDFGGRDDLNRRTAAAAADSPEVHLLIGGTLGRGKASSAALAAYANRSKDTKP
ncbi:hypothetical protein ACIBCO_37325 [Streptomyces violascens]|uniref:hypothetical protein n=1 Tax=Streptomyces violascens TaxID=67381 RepID=UPI0037B29AD5